MPDVAIHPMPTRCLANLLARTTTEMLKASLKCKTLLLRTDFEPRHPDSLAGQRSDVERFLHDAEARQTLLASSAIAFGAHRDFIECTNEFRSLLVDASNKLYECLGGPEDKPGPANSPPGVHELGEWLQDEFQERIKNLDTRAKDIAGPSLSP